MNRYRHSLLIGVLCTLAPAIAAGQDQSIMRAILADPTAQQHILEAAKKSTVFVKNPCADAKFRFTGNIAIYVTPERDGSGPVGKGAWKEEIREEGCGQTRTLNVLGSVPGVGKFATIPLLPGTTHGDPLLQKDAVQYAMLAAGAHGNDCSQGYIDDTEFVSREGAAVAGGNGPPWRELWTVACGRKVQVTMRFTPDATGTTIGAESPKAAPAQSKN